MTTVFREIFDTKKYRPFLEATEMLGAKRVQARAGGCWRVAKGAGKGELCWGPMEVRGVTSHGQIKAIVDGKPAQLIPAPDRYAKTDRPEWWITFEIEF